LEVTGVVGGSKRVKRASAFSLCEHLQILSILFSELIVVGCVNVPFRALVDGEIVTPHPSVHAPLTFSQYVASFRPLHRLLLAFVP
jgi:hypothetical protein